MRLSVLMDGALCQREANGSVLIRLNTRNNLVMFILLFPAFIGVIGIVICGILTGLLQLAFDSVKGLGNSHPVLNSGTTILVLTSFLIGLAILTIIRAEQRFPTRFNVETRMLEVERGHLIRQIPFREIARIFSEKTLVAEPLFVQRNFIVHLVDQSQLMLGTLSASSLREVDSRSFQILQWLNHALSADREPENRLLDRNPYPYEFA